MAKRIEYIDIAKAICIILVVVGHFCPEYAPSWYESIHDIIYSFHMPLFMFASGLVYIATKKETTYREFLTKKFKRLMIPYFSTSVIVITIKLLTQGNAYVENPVSMWSYLKMFYLPEAGYFLWFIWALWWMFVLIPLFKTKASRLVLFAASVVLHYVNIPLPREFCIYEFHVMLFFFMLGIVVYEWKGLYMRLSQPSIVPTVLSTLLFIVIAGDIATQGTLLIRGGYVVLLKQATPFIGIWFILEVSKWIEHTVRLSALKGVLLTTAGSSYIIYLFHTTFEGFAKAFCVKLPIDYTTNIAYSIEAIFVISIGTVVPILLHRYVLKRYKVTKILFGV